MQYPAERPHISNTPTPTLDGRHPLLTPIASPSPIVSFRQGAFAHGGYLPEERQPRLDRTRCGDRDTEANRPMYWPPNLQGWQSGPPQTALGHPPANEAAGLPRCNLARCDRLESALHQQPRRADGRDRLSSCGPSMTNPLGLLLGISQMSPEF